MLTAPPTHAPQPPPGACWLLDAHVLLHRYHHAAGVEFHKGKQVHAVRGLARLVTKIREQHQPHAMALVFDSPSSSYSGRRDLLPSYKANRKPTPPELLEQIEMARAWMPERYGCDAIRVDDHEADDVIASLALSTRKAGYSVCLSTTDKDLYALISDDSPPIAVYNRATGKGCQGWRLYTEADVRDRFGVAPNRLLDWLALVGDDSDNVPGVPGVGEKTAAELLRQYGDLHTLLSVSSSVKQERVRLALREHGPVVKSIRKLLDPVVIPPDLLVRGIHAARPVLSSSPRAPAHP